MPIILKLKAITQTLIFTCDRQICVVFFNIKKSVSFLEFHNLLSQQIVIIQILMDVQTTEIRRNPRFQPARIVLFEQLRNDDLNNQRVRIAGMYVLYPKFY